MTKVLDILRNLVGDAAEDLLTEAEQRAAELDAEGLDWRAELEADDEEDAAEVEDAGGEEAEALAPAEETPGPSLDAVAADLVDLRQQMTNMAQQMGEARARMDAVPGEVAEQLRADVAKELTQAILVLRGVSVALGQRARSDEAPAAADTEAVGALKRGLDAAQGVPAVERLFLTRRREAAA